ncbi:hypothetical protein DV736_g2420, partial [Chaetothyriales sp. CBS 134916]
MGPSPASQGLTEDGAAVRPPQIDPISQATRADRKPMQQILNRTKSPAPLLPTGSSNSLSAAGPAGERDATRLRPTSDPAAPPPRIDTATSNKLTKDRDKKKGVSFLSRIMGARKRDDWSRAEDSATESIENRLAGNEAEIFSGPVGFIPRLPGPPKYIKVKVQNRRKKSFDRLFLAQVLLGEQQQRPARRRVSIDSKIRSINDGPPVQTQPPSRKADKAIWAMEFSMDGRYLAAGGQDKKVRVWEVIQTPEDRDGTCDDGEQQKLHAPVFKQALVREYDGHTASILDLSWSKNNFLLSSSMDKTVRLYHVSRPECLCAFRHNDFVTSIQFHPRDDRFFLAGSLDSRIRLWSIPDRTVAYSQQVPDMVTAVAFTPDGETAIAGTLTGLCILYDTEGLKPHSQIHVKSARGKNSRGSKITGIDTIAIQNDNGRSDVKLLITSNDSRIRMYNMKNRALEVKFRGNENMCSQIHASFSDDAKFVICGSEDRKVYIWPTGPIEHIDGDKHPLEVFEAHSTIATTALLLPTTTRRLLAQSGDPIYDICNPPPVTLLSRADSVFSSPSPTHNSAHSTDDKRPSGPASRQSESPRRAAESPAYLTRHDHYCGLIIVTADYSGHIKVFRQDCAYQKRRQESWDDSSSFPKKMVTRSGSSMTKHSITSSKHRHRSPSLRQTSSSRNGSSERILNWRNSIHPTGTTAGSSSAAESEMSLSFNTAPGTIPHTNGPGPASWTKRLSMRMEGTLKRNNGGSSPSISPSEGGGRGDGGDDSKKKRSSIAIATPAIGPSIELTPDTPAQPSATSARTSHQLKGSNTQDFYKNDAANHYSEQHQTRSQSQPGTRIQRQPPAPSSDNHLFLIESHSMMPWDEVTRAILPMVQKSPRTPGLLGPDDHDHNPLSRQRSIVSELSSDFVSSDDPDPDLASC